eukprot:scaffold906_cov186-Alexandrium_tamarense.AAC.15
MKTVAKNKTLSDITDAMSLDVLNMIADERALLSQHDETKSIASILAIKCKHERQGNGMITLEYDTMRKRLGADDTVPLTITTGGAKVVDGWKKCQVCRGDLLIGVGAYDVKKLTPNEFKEGVGVWNLWYGQISDGC